MAREVVPSVSLDALLIRREAAVAALRKIAEGVAEYRAVGEVIWAGDFGEAVPHAYREPVNHRPSGRGAYLDDGERWLAASTAAVDAAIWDHLLEKSGLRTFLDAKAREEWRKQIEERKTSPLTPDNVRATFAGLYERRGEFFERGVVEVFRSLSWNYKTNRPEKFGRRVVVRAAVTASGHPGFYADKLDDLDRALHVLDGKPEPDHRASVSARLWNREPRHAPVASPYFKIRTFKNGSGHVAFTRLDLVDEMNRILAKHYPDALPPGARP